MTMIKGESPILDWINKDSRGEERRQRVKMERKMAKILKEFDVHELAAEAIAISFSMAIAEYVVEAIAGNTFKREQQ